MHHDLYAANDAVIVKMSKKLSHTVGKVAAMLVSDFHYWLKTDSGVVIDGVRYVYNTYPALAEKMDCSRATVARAIKILKEKGIILVGQFDKRKTIRTNYYTLDYKALEELLGEDNIYSEKVGKNSSESAVKKDQNETVSNLKKTPSSIQRLPIDILIKSEPVGRASAPHETIQNMDERDETAEPDAETKPQEPEKPKVRKETAKNMLDLWNKFIYGNDTEKYLKMTKDRARYLVAAFQRKFGGCMKNWENFCEMISKSDFLMGRTFSTNKFLIQLDWAIKFSTIDRILNGELGCKKPQKSQREVSQKHYEDCAEFVQKEENSTLRTYKQHVLDFFNGQRRAGAFKAYFIDCKWFVDEETGVIKLGAKSTFCASYIMQYFAYDLKKILGRNVECFVAV